MTMVVFHKNFSNFFEKNFYKMVSLFPISEGVLHKKCHRRKLFSQNTYIFAILMISTIEGFFQEYFLGGLKTTPAYSLLSEGAVFF